MEYFCETCNYKTHIKTNFNRHNNSRNHQTLCGISTEKLDYITLEKMNYEIRIKELEISLKYEKEKNELLLYILNRQSINVQAPVPASVAETIPALVIAPVAETIIKTKFELLTRETVPEAKIFAETNPSSPRRKYKNIKEFVEKNCIIDQNTFGGFLKKIKENIEDIDIGRLISNRTNKFEYVFQLIRKTYSSYSKNNKPYYNDDKIHKKCYCVNNNMEWSKEVIANEIINLLTQINQMLLDKAENMGKIVCVTEEMINDWYTINGTDDIDCPLREGVFIKSKEYNNINIMDYEDYNVFADLMVEKFNDIIYISKEEMN
jgi:hypothetical protein